MNDVSRNRTLFDQPIPGSSPDHPARTPAEVNDALHLDNLNPVWGDFVGCRLTGVSACGATLLGRAEGAVLCDNDFRGACLEGLTGLFTIQRSNVTHALFDRARVKLLDCEESSMFAGDCHPVEVPA